MKYLLSIPFLIVTSSSYTADNLAHEFCAQQAQNAYQNAYAWYHHAALASSTAQNYATSIARMAKQAHRIQSHSQALLNHPQVPPAQRAQALLSLEHTNQAQEQLAKAEQEILNTCYSKASAHTYYLQAVTQASTPAHADTLDLVVQQSSHACTGVLQLQTTIAKAMEHMFLASNAYQVIKHISRL